MRSVSVHVRSLIKLELFPGSWLGSLALDEHAEKDVSQPIQFGKY